MIINQNHSDRPNVKRIPNQSYAANYLASPNKFLNQQIPFESNYKPKTAVNEFVPRPRITIPLKPAKLANKKASFGLKEIKNQIHRLKEFHSKIKTHINKYISLQSRGHNMNVSCGFCFSCSTNYVFLKCFSQLYNLVIDQ